MTSALLKEIARVAVSQRAAVPEGVLEQSATYSSGINVSATSEAFRVD